MIEATSLPPALSNVIVYSFIFHKASIITFSPGIKVGISLSQPKKLYPSFSGVSIFSNVLSICELYSWVIDKIGVPPLELKITLNIPISYCALIVKSSLMFFKSSLIFPKSSIFHDVNK